MVKQSRYHLPEYAQEYDEDRFGGSFGARLERQEIELFTALLDGCHGEILDVGSGTGKLSLALLGQGKEVMSSDFSLEMLGVARQKGAERSLPLRCVVADMQALAFKPQAFCCTLSSRALMHVGNWRRAIAELCRVTSRAVIIDFPPRISVAGIDAVRLKLPPLLKKKPHYGYRTFLVRAVKREFEKNGFAIVEVRRSYVLPILLHRWLNKPRLSGMLERMLGAVGLVHLFGAPVTIKAVRRPTG